ncbi:MAG: thioredoxin-like domain-containing protein [Pirellulaceae bacterium]
MTRKTCLIPLLVAGWFGLYGLSGGAGAVCWAAPRPVEAAEPAADTTDEGKPKTTPKSDTAQAPSAAPASPAAPAAQPEVDGEPHPFPRRIPIPEFPQDLQWLNTAQPLKKADVAGKFVLFDFWTYCCINCMHILPELKKLERAYPGQLVVVGVHSAKFETEKQTKNIEEAILRYEIEHPVVNDADHRIWDTYGVRSWPTAILIDPTGHAVWGRSGEFQFAEVDTLLKKVLPYYRQRGLMNETPLKFALLADARKRTPLAFPGKVLVDEVGQRLFIADSNHNRVVIVDLEGTLQAVIGSGAIGREDGDFATATFDHPQGMALAGGTLYVADTENHLLRRVDLQTQRVTTIAGTGVQARHAWPGLDVTNPTARLPDRFVGPPRTTAINSPWDLWIHGRELYIAMAGPHQIWKMPLDESEIGPYAGNGREDIVDGPLLPAEPYQTGFASFAQPSGLSSDGTWLYVADSEGSSIRAVPFDATKEVRTVVGTSHLPFNRLFHFGDQDGERQQALLQHCLGVTYHAGQLYVADTYNNKIKVVDASTGAVRTLAGTGQPGYDDAQGLFDEPAGLAFGRGKLYVADTNNHRIRTVEVATGKVATLVIDGLVPPRTPSSAAATPP